MYPCKDGVYTYVCSILDVESMGNRAGESELKTLPSFIIIL